MSATVNFAPSLIDAYNAINTSTELYPAGSFVRTLGFFAPGDGGAAVYRVNHNQLLKVNGECFYYNNGVFSAGCFELVPQNGMVFVEQFGVVPGNPERCSDNSTLMNLAVNYASSNGLVLAFSPKQTYYFDSSIFVKSNLFIEGNDAVVRVYKKNDDSACNLFNMSGINDIQKNVVVSNLTVIGRTIEHYNPGDQAFHVCIDGFTLRNVKIKNFSFGVHTYGRDVTAGEYTVPEIPNKNWLIEGCSISDTVTGLMLSEIDGLTIKGSSISCRLDASKYDHCIYMSSNCLNVRITDTALYDVSGGAIHKAYAVPAPDSDTKPKADISKNHFYTDLSIHNARSALDICIISQNVMCDNIFVTDVNYALHLSGADNCIISNLHVAKNESDTSTRKTDFIYAEEACNCWLQNSYVYYTGRHRITTSQPKAAYIKQMFADKKHRRMLIGSEFKIPNHWFKFTGCDIESKLGYSDTYFYEGYLEVVNPKVDISLHKDPSSAQYGEYWDNCLFETNTTQDVFYLNCINDLPGGITIRNSYMENVELDNRHQPPFRIGCNRENRNSEYCQNVCPVYSDSCVLSMYGKTYPWIRFENNFYAFKFSIYWRENNWLQYIKGNTMSVEQFAKLTCSYSSNCYTVEDTGKLKNMENLMAI